MSVNGASSLLDGTIGVGDAVLIEPLDEDNFLENIQLRFNHDNIYTFIGSVVVSVNPYKPLTIYDSDTIEKYRGRNLYELHPHIFAVSNLSYTSMKNYGRDQCILITGESGSGKTEASKLVMKYVSAVSGHSSEVERIKEQLLQSNPVLEAFGNAKTNRNDNSSRFGKYMDIEFDFKGDPVGGVITNYLLEKSRVIKQATGERNFHIFYLLLAGAPAPLLEKLKLKGGAENYNYLKQGECVRTDAAFFKQVMDAFDVIGFSRDETDAILHLVSSILKLGNVKFKSAHMKNGMENCEVDNTEEVEEICESLALEKSALISALTERRVVASQDTVTVNLSANEASYSRNALCKEMYDRLFTWLVARINSSIKASDQQHKRCRVMGVLDIYGFEVFDNNGFEQFMINYCNEKLQQIFIELTLKEEQEEYVREGIEWVHIDYFNNAIICQLIESPHTGILSMLDEECLRPGDVTDQTFLTKLETTYGKHEHFESRTDSRFLNDKTLPHEAFRILHYAGKVTYLVENFIDKNNNALYRSLSVAAFMSQNFLLGGKNGLFPEGDPSLSVLKRAPTIATQFKGSMTALMKNLLSKNPNYIRCIKPNNVKRSGVFTSDLVRHQVRYLGLLENVRVRRAGYAYRQTYEECLKRYKMLSPSTWPVWKSTPREGMRNILRDVKTTTDEYACGKTKLFIRNPRTLFALENMRSEKLHDVATIIQKRWRGFYLWKKFQIMKKAQIVISKYVKRHQARQNYLKLCAAALVFQCYIRGWKARCILRAKKLHKRRCEAVTTIAAFWKGYLARCILRAKKLHKRRCEAVTTIAAFWKGYLARCVLRAMKLEKRRCDAATTIAAHWKGHQTRVEFRKFFRANAGKVIAKMMDKFVIYKYLTDLASNLPSMSPINTDWPPCKYAVVSDAHGLLKTIFYAWKCMKYRKSLTSERVHQLKEKLEASNMFKGKKTLYPSSLPQLFAGDHVQLSSNEKWKKVASENGEDKILFADNGFKINRANGKAVVGTVVLTNQCLLLLDAKYVVKSRILVNDIKNVYLSPYRDGMIVVHSTPEDLKNHKGDLIVNVSNSIELATKLSMLKKSNKQDINFTIADKIELQCKGVTQLQFSQQSGIEGPEVKKQKNIFLVSVPQ